MRLKLDYRFIFLLISLLLISLNLAFVLAHEEETEKIDLDKKLKKKILRK